MLKNKLRIVLTIVVIAILAGGISVYATYNYLASEVKYTKEDGTETDVEKSLNELYEKINTKKIDYNIIYFNQIVGSYNYDYKISEEDLKYKNIMVIISATNTGSTQKNPASATVTNDNIIQISNGAQVNYTEYGVHVESKLYIGVIKNIVKDDVINMTGFYGSTVLILGIK